jgi:hypothetical protein
MATVLRGLGPSKYVGALVTHGDIYIGIKEILSVGNCCVPCYNQEQHLTTPRSGYIRQSLTYATETSCFGVKEMSMLATTEKKILR